MPLNSLSDMFLSKLETHGNRTFLRHRVGGKWEEVTWSKLSRMVDETALGLIRLGVAKGEAVCILSENCASWIAADLAIVSIGAITSAIYASNTPEECAYIFNHSEARVIFVQNKAQFDKIIAASPGMPKLAYIIVFEHELVPATPGVMKFTDLMVSGRAGDQNLRDEFTARRTSLKPDDILTYIYTSGTTGPPKGVMLSHGNVLFICETYKTAGIVKSGDDSLSILPLAHALERMIFYITLHLGGTVSISDDIYKTGDYLKEVRPSIMICVPRVVEKVYEKIQSKSAASSPMTRKIFNWSVEVGKQVAFRKHHGAYADPILKIKYAIARKLVFGKIIDGVGGRLRMLGCGGAPLAPEIVEFFCAAGIPLVQAWGLTETSAPSTQMPIDAIRYDSVGKPIDGVEVNVAVDGELIVRGPNVFKGYYKNPNDTAAAFKDGWFHTGDLGEIDEEGYVKIIGRKKELIITSGGKNISPQNLEFLFMSSRYINQAVIVGDSRPYLTALFTLQLEEIRPWAVQQGIVPEPGRPLELHPKINELIASELNDKNQTLPRYMTIKKFRIIPGEFTQETGELTPTMKTKKNVIFRKYSELIEDMYRA